MKVVHGRARYADSCPKIKASRYSLICSSWRQRNNYWQRVFLLFSCIPVFIINKNISPMARLSNVNEGLIQAVGRKPKYHTTYGRHNRNKRLSRVDGLPLSPPEELRPRRPWTSINKGRSVRQIEDGLMQPSGTQKLLVKSSPASSPAPQPLRESTKGGLELRRIANESVVQSMHVPALQPNTAPNRSPFQSRNRLRPKPTTSENNTGKSAAVETPNQADFPPPDINQLSKPVGKVPVSDDHTQARTSIHNSKLGLSVDTEMEEANGDGRG
jgi:hypothetical protein